MDMETTVVKRERNEFIVSDIEDLHIKVRANQVHSITSRVPDVEEKEIAILLATINEARIIIMPILHLGGKDYKKVDEKTENDAIIDLLQNYDVDTLNSIFEEMKYCEIKDVLESTNPISALEDSI